MAHRARYQRIGGTIDALQPAFIVDADMLFENFAIAHGKARGRQRVDDFVGEQHAAPVRFGRAIEPVHAIVDLHRQIGQQPFSLTLAQVGARFENQVVTWQRMACRQRPERRLGKGAAAAAKLQKIRLFTQ